MRVSIARKIKFLGKDGKVLNYHLRRRYREDIPRYREGRGERSTEPMGDKGGQRGRGATAAKYPGFEPPEIRARGISLSRKQVTKRNIVEPYISDGALMKHSRSRHSEITRDRLDYSRAGTWMFSPLPPSALLCSFPTLPVPSGRAERSCRTVPRDL